MSLVRSHYVNHYSTIDKSFESDIACPICLENFNDSPAIGVSETACEHFFHEPCLDKWFQTNRKELCPMCKFDLKDTVFQSIHTKQPVQLDLCNHHAEALTELVAQHRKQSITASAAVSHAQIENARPGAVIENSIAATTEAHRAIAARAHQAVIRHQMQQRAVDINDQCCTQFCVLL